MKTLELSHQRDLLSLERKHKLAILRALKGESAELVYANQKVAACEIVDHYLRGIVWVLLIAQPGAGKTGVMMEVLRQLGEHNGKQQVHIDDMLVCTGMSDKDWEATLKNGMLPSLKSAVYHRSNIAKKDLSAMSNGIVVTDECHVAAEADMTLSKALKNAGLLDVDALEARNMRMLDVSATPEGVLADLSRWQEKTAVVVLQPGEKYKGFQSMLDDGRLLEAGGYDLTKPEDAYRLLKMFDDRYVGKGKKYFPIRVSEKSKKKIGGDARANIAAAAIRLGWNAPWIHDSKNRVENIDETMKTTPEKHTPILIKGFWRASKRFVRTHVGGSYESKSTARDDTTTAQGLTARFCDTFDWEGEQADNAYRPLHFADVKAIKEYLEWCRAGYDYRAAAYKGKRIKSDGRGRVENPMTKVHPDQVSGVVKRDEDPVAPVQLPLPPYRLYDDYEIARAAIEILGYRAQFPHQTTADGFYKTSVNREAAVHSVEEVKAKLRGAYGGGGALRTMFACYVDKNDASTLRFLVVLREDTPEEKIAEADAICPYEL